MRKFSLLIVVFGLLIVAFAFILPVNKYGFEGSLDCDGPLRSIIFLSLGIAFTVIGGLVFMLKPFWDWKSNRTFYCVIFLSFVIVSLKIPEIYRESEVNQECEP